MLKCLVFTPSTSNWAQSVLNVDLTGLQHMFHLEHHARGLDWYTGYQHKFMSIKSMSLLKPGAIRCHSTRIARGVPLPVYINLDLYSGFWCTSRCVVFKYSVPPLTDQVLWKVLLTSWKKLTIVVWWASNLLDVLFSSHSYNTSPLIIVVTLNLGTGLF